MLDQYFLYINYNDEPLGANDYHFHHNDLYELQKMTPFEYEARIVYIDDGEPKQEIRYFQWWHKFKDSNKWQAGINYMDYNFENEMDLV